MHVCVSALLIVCIAVSPLLWCPHVCNFILCTVFVCIHNMSHAVPNTGLVLWAQQFSAMFMKKFYNTLRFWQAIVSQLILPLFFVLFAMILAITATNSEENDPPRALRLDNSALDPDNRIVFFAELGNGEGFFDFGVGSYFL